MPSLRNALLPFSIRNAACLPFYEKFWDGVDVGAISSIKDLCLLPTLSKEHYRNSLMFDASAISDTDYITHTTGTTGALTWRHRSAGEAAIIDQLFGYNSEPSSEIAERSNPRAEQPKAELMLVFRYNRHGMAMPMPGQLRSIPIGLNDDTELKQSVQMLKATYHFAEGVLRPTTIAGSAYDVALLAQAWIEARLTETIDIRLLHVSGFVDSGLHSFLHSAFSGAAVIENYSLTEIFGGATRELPSTSFSLDPYVIGEVVDESGQPVVPGSVGELLLTELFPFVQMQPLIRYRTGDVVRLVSNIDDNFVFEWWGRRRDCVLSPIDGVNCWVLGYRPIADWLSLQPLVARHSFKSYLASITSVDFGTPCFIVRSEPDGSTVGIDIGLRVNPWWAKEAVRCLAQDFWCALRSMMMANKSVPVRLSFRHVSGPTQDFNKLADTHALRFSPTALSDPAPNFP